MLEIPAATAVLARDGRAGFEVLMLKRSHSTSFAADAWVFPGGRVESADVEGVEGSDVFGLAAAQGAAAREAEEEAGIAVDGSTLRPLAHWTPGPEAPKRFATWMLFGPIDADALVRVDGGEIVDHRWMSPGAALEEHRKGRIAMLPPTWVTLHALSWYSTYAAAATAIASAPIERFVSRLANTAAYRVILWEGDAGYQTANADEPGARHRLYLDDRGWRYERR